MSQSSVLQVGRYNHGFVIRIVGHGTMRESETFQEFVLQCLGHRGATIVVDLSDCDYLDSTFLGCLIGLQKRTAADPSRFVIAADPSTRVRLFSTTLLDHVLSSIDDCPRTEGELLPLAVRHLNARELGSHVAQAHRCLASTGCDESESFSAIADRLEAELSEDIEAELSKDIEAELSKGIEAELSKGIEAKLSEDIEAERRRKTKAQLRKQKRRDH